MKGIIFTEFLDMVEEKFGYEVASNIVEKSHPISGGAYTAVGTYSHKELLDMVGVLSQETSTQKGELVKFYAEYLFKRLIDLHPQISKRLKGTFEVLESLEYFIHVEVKKIYPDAELPSFQFTRLSDSQVKLIYVSERKLHDFAEGLISGSAKYFEENIKIDKKLINADGSVVEFLISIV